MSELTRRELFLAFGAAGLLRGESYVPQFFTPHEYETLRMLADFILPADANSGGAIDAGAAEFIDFICAHSESNAGYCRYNLRWIDGEMQRRSGAVFTEAAREDQVALLDLIAYRKNSTPAISTVVDFFSYLRGLVVDAYYTSPVGIADIGYMGNRVVESFSVPAEAVAYALGRSPFGGG
jgi:gluconate 2-dehydrogenase gamma chain